MSEAEAETSAAEVSNQAIAAIRDAKGAFTEFKKLIDEACEHFEDGDDQSGLSVFRTIISGLEDFAEFSLTIRKVFLLCEMESIIDYTENCENYTNTLATLMDAMEVSDYVSIADQLNFDLRTILSKFEKMMDDFVEKNVESNA